MQQSRSIRAADPILAHYMLFWAAQKALEIRASSPANNTQEVTRWLLSAMDEIEKSKASLALPSSGQDYVLERAFKAFMFADRADRAGQRTKSTAAAFRTAALSMEALRQFGEVPEEVATRMKYSVWRAAHLMTKIAAGETPDPPPSATAEEEELNQLAQQEPDNTVHQNVASFPAVPTGGASPGNISFPSVPQSSSSSSSSSAFSLPSAPKSNVSLPPPAYSFAPPPVLPPQQSPALPPVLPPVVPSQQQQQQAPNPYSMFPSPPTANIDLFSFPAPPGGGGGDVGGGGNVGSSVGGGVGGVGSSGNINPYAALGQFPAVPSTPSTGGSNSAAAGAASSSSSLEQLFDLPSVPTKRAGEDVLPPAPPVAHQHQPPSKSHSQPPPAPAASSRSAMAKSRAGNSDDDSDEDSDDGGGSSASKRPVPLLQVGAQPRDYHPRAADIAAAQKLSKTAFSALNFDDTATAVRDLCMALTHLTGTPIQVIPKKIV